MQLKLSDQHPSIPYKVQDVYKAANLILQGASATQSVYMPPAAPVTYNQPAPAPATKMTIKKEDLASLLAEFTKRNWTTNMNVVQIISCLMCGGPHLVNTCAIVLDYIKAGKCKCNQEGKVVLPSGAYIPWEIPGNNFQEHIDK